MRGSISTNLVREPVAGACPALTEESGWPWIAAPVLVGVAASWVAFGRVRPAAAPATIDGAMRQITEMPGAEGEPHVSPDGRQIVFSSRAGGQWDIYVLRVGGSRAINLTADSPADDREPAFSPNSEQIAFRSERGGGGIFVMGATGESVRRVTATGYDPAWSPDGRSLAYLTEPVSDPYRSIYPGGDLVADVASGKAHRLTTTDGVQPAWSRGRQTHCLLDEQGRAARHRHGKRRRRHPVRRDQRHRDRLVA